MTATAKREKASKSQWVTWGRNDTREPVAIQAHVNSYVQLDGGRLGDKLLVGDDFVDEGFAGCDFRYPNPVREWRESRAIACNVHVTGRTFQFKSGYRVVRVKVEWVGDCEPSTFTSGWLYI
jgi:hypothetical protein